jgi:RNA polymerase sigma factor (TIGR02999 family)
MGDATQLLSSLDRSNSEAAEKLLVVVYEDLRRLAAHKMAQESDSQTLQPTALVHEAWLRLVRSGSRSFENRAHFFSAAAEAMRRLLIDRARRRQAQRHGGGCERVELEEIFLASPGGDEQLLALNEALDRLAKKHPIHAKVVNLRYFAGMTNEEISEIMGISVSTAKNYWIFSRAWLFNEMTVR